MRYLTLEKNNLIQKGDKEVVFFEGAEGVYIPEVPIEKVGLPADGFLILRPIAIPTYNEVTKQHLIECDNTDTVKCDNEDRSCEKCFYHSMLKLMGVTE